MTFESYIKLFFCFLCCTSILSCGSASTFPVSFQSQWDVSKAACTGTSVTRLEIAHNSISYWESTGKPVYVKAIDKTSLEVRLKMHGEGEQWFQIRKFKLSNSENELTENFNSGQNFKRVRC